jgi:hypothetical protein
MLAHGRLCEVVHLFCASDPDNSHLDMIAFVLFLIFVLASSVIFLRRGDAVRS